MRAVRRRAVLGGLVAAAVLGTTLVVPPQASAAPIDQNALANVLVGDYVRVADKDRDYAKHLVASAELLDYRAAHPDKDEKALADHLGAVQAAIEKAVPSSLGQDYEIAGAALIAVQNVADATMTGPQIEKLLAALTARDTRPQTGLVMDRLSGALQVYSWNVGYETAQSDVWAGVASTARADAKFDNAWFTALGGQVSAGGFHAKSTAVDISKIPEFQQYFDVGQFLKLQDQPDQLKLFTQQKMNDQIAKTEQDIKDGKVKLEEAKPDPTKTKEQLTKDQEDRQKYIDGAKSAFDGLSWFLGAVGDKDAARDLKTFASGAIQVATAINKCITAFQAINAVMSLATVAFTGNVIGAISTLVGLFAGAGPDINAQILEEIGNLRKDIQSLHNDMLKQFARIDQRLADMTQQLNSQLDALQGTVDQIKGRVDAVVKNLISIDGQLRTLGTDTAKGFQGVLVQPTLSNADAVLDLGVTHPGKQVTDQMYTDAEKAFHLAGTQTPATPGVFVADPGTAQDTKTAVDELGKFGPAGNINYLAAVANSRWGAKITVPDTVGNPAMWKLGANALTLLNYQNPNLARADGSLLWAQDVLGQGRTIVSAAQAFSQPGADGATTPLFNGLMGEYIKELVTYFNQLPSLERDITVTSGYSDYNLWAGPTQPTDVLAHTDDNDQIEMCNNGSTDFRIARPDNMKASQLPPATMFARNIFGSRPGYAQRPGYGVCWYANFENQHDVVSNYECDDGDGHVYTCVDTSTYADLKVDFTQSVCFPGDCGIEGPDKASRWGTMNLKQNILLKECGVRNDGTSMGCTDNHLDPRDMLKKDWDTTYRGQFEGGAAISASDATEAGAKTQVENFLRARQADYYNHAAQMTGSFVEKLQDTILLMRGYTELAFPRALQTDDQLRGLLYGGKALLSNFLGMLQVENPPPGQDTPPKITPAKPMLQEAFERAAANLTRKPEDGGPLPAWQQEQFDGDVSKPCGHVDGIISADPFINCMAWSATLRLNTLADRYADHFKQRALGADESLPDVQNQLRNLWLVTKTVFPNAGDLGGSIDPKPVTVQVDADYDGDHKTDSAFWRPSDGTWSVQPSTGGPVQTVQLGQQGDLPVPADYDGTGKAEPAVVRPSESTFYARQLSGDTPAATQEWLRPDYKPVPADYGKMQLLAQRLTTLAYQFSSSGRGADSPTSQALARDIYRKLATADASFRPQLANSSVILGAFLDSAGKKAEALPPSQEGVDIYRALGDKPNLAWALNNLGYRLSDAGRAADAPVAERESRDIFRSLGDQYRPQLASASVILGSFDQNAGLHDESVTVTREGADIYRALGDKPSLAWALTNLAYRLSAAGKSADAPAPAQEAHDIYRSLGSAYRSQLANSAVLLGSFLDSAGRHDEAIAAAKEGADGYRQLGDQPNLGWALYNLAYRYADAGRPADAATAEQESRDIYRTLAKTDPQTYQPQWAEAAFLLGTWLKQANQIPAARDAAQEAVDQFTILAAANPAYNARLKDSQNLRASLG